MAKSWHASLTCRTQATNGYPTGQMDDDPEDDEYGSENEADDYFDDEDDFDDYDDDDY